MSFALSAQTGTQPYFPRVLIIYLSAINAADQHAMSLRKWFGAWPRERLAQIYSGNEQGDARFCAETYRLGMAERRLGRVFMRLRHSPLAGGEGLYILSSSDRVPANPTRARLIKQRLSRTLVESGLWELVFRPRVSASLESWIRAFDPEVIYCQGYSLSFTWLPLLIQQRFDIPICFHTTDDWPTYLYRNSFVAPLIRPVVERSARQLIAAAERRLAIGPSMAGEYSVRYGTPFQTLMQCDDFDRFRASLPLRADDASTVSIVYTGSLALGRWRSILDLCQAANILNEEGTRVSVTVYASMVPPEAIVPLGNAHNLRLRQPPEHDQVPQVLRGADILFLPETFEDQEAEDIKLSISSKAHLYMMSERPVLVYAAAATGIADYARAWGWAHVVDQQGAHALAASIRDIIQDKEGSKALVRTAVDVALRNHDEHKVQNEFRSIMADLALHGSRAGSSKR